MVGVKMRIDASGVIIAFVSLFNLVGCAPSSFQATSDFGSSDKKENETANYQHSKADCLFVGPSVLKDRMVSLLEIPAGDVPVLNDQGVATSDQRLASSSAVLGLGDLRAGRLDDYTCGAPKFKASMEIMIDACALAFQNPAVKSKLFPSGLSNFDELYRAFVGRLPTQYESQILKDLAAALPSSKSESAVCGAVASSFESLIRI